MTLNQLVYYVEVVKQRNFTRAAESIFVSSKSIRNLEEELHVHLIDRSGKGFALTPEGEMFAEYAERIVRFYYSQLREFRLRQTSVDKTLNVGMPPSAGTAYFYSVLRDFRQMCGDVKLNTIEVPAKEVLERLYSGALDIGVVLEPCNDDGLVIKRCFESDVVACVNVDHPLAKRDSVTFAELKDEPIIMITNEFMFHDLCMDCFDKAGVKPNVVFETSQWDLEYEMTAENEGICFLPEILVAKQKGNRVKTLKLTEPNFPWILSLAYRKDTYLSTPMKMFVELSSGSYH